MQHHWGTRGAGRPTTGTLNLMVELDGGPIGAAVGPAPAEFAVYRTVATGSWLGRRFQGRGFGKEMRAAVLGFAFDGLGARGRRDVRVPRQRCRRTAVSRALGYEENGFGSLAPEGVARGSPRSSG